jgi:hypothetical protein
MAGHMLRKFSMFTPTSAPKIKNINTQEQPVYNLLSGDHSSFDSVPASQSVQIPRPQASVSAGHFSLHQNRGFQILQAKAAAARSK